MEPHRAEAVLDIRRRMYRAIIELGRLAQLSHSYLPDKLADQVQQELDGKTLEVTREADAQIRALGRPEEEKETHGAAT